MGFTSVVGVVSLHTTIDTSDVLVWLQHPMHSMGKVIYVRRRSGKNVAANISQKFILHGSVLIVVVFSSQATGFSANGDQ